MRADVIAIAVVFTFIAILVGALPAVTRPTLPLGVSVPAERLDEPVIRRAIRRYRVMIAIAWLLCMVLLAVLAVTASPAWVLLAVFLFIVAQLAAYVIARRMIIRAKRDGDWYAGVPVRIAGSVSVPAEPAPVPVGWAVASAVLLACGYIAGILLYPTLPATVPTHWGISGQPDRWADKSVWSVFGPLFIGTVVVALLFALSFLGRRVPIRALPGVDAATNVRRDHAMRAAMSALIGRVMFLIALSFSWTTLALWLLPDVAGLRAGGTVAIVVLILLVVVLFVLRWRSLMRGDAATVAAERAVHATVDAPDDDRFWKAGILYLNRDDPALFVQRRFGVGWTVNLGRPAGVVITVLVGLLIVGLVGFVLVQAVNGG
ncbi:hypothetical protein LK09_16735 [Microbacterium mangrovi]|uniref:DUF1648 domain-containing protein n=1 Tax=Microbacterium mangrovi TaxID=1348253 RepID=A0A0B2A354_9MICO|nr:DUF1648 domain-containing protein [Microbacterium mangrovi]KHK96008.1 hypothetical protein LK09_16735 [Microbacterium mangrovi]